ncbi:hypothetical protein OSB04_020451 [Centaurea solstitialis]|uniref:IST1-like protein n=1 Tax=Centaurea solstitialis TaxID=347529 RepID=A0AA38SZW3_9ASTR|nr:hypothetical protein OSB04_020451 [Centaurea solstitialis]
MLHKSFKPAKCKTSLKLAISRIKLMKNKKGVQINQMKRELSQLLESSQDRTARIRVEHVIREEKMVAAYELIEIYCELIVARMAIIESQKVCPLDLKEAVTSVIFAAPRCSDISELSDIRKHFTKKYGKEFVSAATELRPDCGVSRLLVEKLSAIAPDVKTKIKVLSDVAKEHNINWDPTSFEEKEPNPPSDLLNVPPSRFEKTGTTTADPTKIQGSNIDDVHSRKEKQDRVPIDFAQQNRKYTLDARNTTSTDTETSSGGRHDDTRSSGISIDRHLGETSERMEMKQPVSRSNNDFSSGRENWKMEFKDATSAAQAAAESAERAAMAARAAAQFSRDEKIVNRSHSSDVRDEPPRVSAPKDSNENSVDDRKPKISNQQTGRIEHDASQKSAFVRPDVRSHSSDVRDEPSRVSDPPKDSDEKSVDDRKSKMPSQQTGRIEHDASSQKGAFVRPDDGSIEDENLVNDFRMADGYFEESLNQDLDRDQDSSDPKTTSLERFEESKTEDINYFAEEATSTRSVVGNPFAVVDERNLFRESSKTSSNFDSRRDDEAISDDGGPRFDTGFEYDEGSPTRSLENNHIWNKNDIVEEVSSRSPLFTESNSFPDHSVKYTEPLETEDHVLANFDHSDGPDSDPETETDLFSTKREPFGVESTQDFSSRKTRIELNDLVEKESVDTLEGGDDDSVNRSDDMDARKELKFGTLTGGFRNKGGVRLPPYAKNPVSEASKNSVEESSRTGGEASRLDLGTNRVEDKRTNVSISMSMFFDDGETDSEEEVVVSKRASSGVRLGSGVSRRTRGSHLKSHVEPKGETVISSSSEYWKLGRPDEARSDVGRTFIPARKTTEIGSGSAQEKNSNKSYRNENPPRKPTRSVNAAESGKTEINSGPEAPYSKSHVIEPKTYSDEPSFPRKKSAESGSTASLATKASHVHPKLPDYDSIAARLESLRTSRP